LIYGNTFIYSSGATACREDGVFALWRMMIVMICLGYVIFIGYTIVLLVWGFSLRKSRDEVQPYTSAFMNRVPYVNTLTNLRTLKYGDVEEKYMESCTICLNEYQDLEEVAELKCDKRHYFHSQCLEQWLKKKQECPLCKKKVNV
jgi:hypothetical protein